LSRGGEITYRLYVLEGMAGWSLLAERTIDVGVPTRLVQLLGAAPNPFNPRTEIRFVAPAGQEALVRVFNAHGRQVAVLFDGHATGRVETLVWKPADLGSGVYFVRVESEGMYDAGKMVLLR